MELIKAKIENIPELVNISKRAFDSDIYAGNAEIGGPPEYDSIPWHIKMMNEDHLFAAIDGESVVGGAIIFVEESGSSLYIGRIFVDPLKFKHGYGSSIMNEIEKLYSRIKFFRLDTPVWNTRTNPFYKKLGYTEIKRTDDEIFYEKEVKGKEKPDE